MKVCVEIFISPVFSSLVTHVWAESLR